MTDIGSSTSTAPSPSSQAFSPSSSYPFSQPSFTDTLKSATESFRTFNVEPSISNSSNPVVNSSIASQQRQSEFEEIKHQLEASQRGNKELKCEVDLLKASLEEHQELLEEVEIDLHFKLSQATRTIDFLKSRLAETNNQSGASIETSATADSSSPDPSDAPRKVSLTTSDCGSYLSSSSDGTPWAASQTLSLAEKAKAMLSQIPTLGHRMASAPNINTDNATAPADLSPKDKLLNTERELALLKQVMEHRTRKLEDAVYAKTSFLSHMSHELRTPLFAILGLVAVLEGSPGLSAPQKEHLHTIKDAGEDLQRLIEQVLDITRLESGSVEPETIDIDIRDVAESALDTIASAAQRKNLEVVYANRLAEDPPILRSDMYRIRQILLNYLSNAVKFTVQGSIVVRFNMELIEDDPGYCMGIFSVHDPGMGIPANKLHRLFKSFSQVDSSVTRSFGGSGLGLVISASLAKLMKGEVSVESTVGKGSVFQFSFKAKITDREPSHEKFPRLESPTSVLVCCPSQSLRLTIQAHLEDVGATVTSTKRDLRMWMEKGKAGKGHFDVIVASPDFLKKEDVDKVIEMYPNTQLLLACRLIDINETMSQLQIPYESFICRPVKASALYAKVKAHKSSSVSHLERPKMPRPTVSFYASEDQEEDEEVGKPGKSSLKDPKGKKSTFKTPPVPTSPLRILLVDDSQVNVKVGSKLLEKFGYNNVDVAYDGSQAVDAVAHKQYDLVLLDLQMPVMDGYTAKARISEEHGPEGPLIVALTANTDTLTQSQVFDHGFYAYLSKPLSLPAFKEVLKKVSVAKYPEGAEQ
ncbi:multi-sensor hybrid histidine kinase [Phaffia rhodozyma]|uniref:Multi-sensor hybrid histidine kinase n=1 Tax=Phaffia rhodozyma TaxID=264483 RepID=A0A0F7SQF5_PHARH|nr:multi-sensor hybrid histidine kinase [Phaffia rhodozyma]